jgi:hypothetical protein
MSRHVQALQRVNMKNPKAVFSGSVRFLAGMTNQSVSP